MNIKSPFEGYPDTTQTIRNGKVVFKIKARVLTPAAIKIADILTVAAISYLTYGLILTAGTRTFSQNWEWALYWLSPVLLFSLMRDSFQTLLRTTLTIEMSEDFFTVKKWPGNETFDRKLRHSYALIPHDFTEDEQRNQEFQQRKAQQKGNIIKPNPLYGKSCHLSYQYLDQRNDIAEIYGHKDAMSIVARLNACDEILNGFANMGAGISINPKDEWNDQPGDIDNDNDLD